MSSIASINLSNPLPLPRRDSEQYPLQYWCRSSFFVTVACPFSYIKTGPGILDVITDSRTCLIHYCAWNVRKSKFALFAPFGLLLDKGPYSHSTRYFCEYLNYIIYALIAYLYLFMFFLVHAFPDFFSIKTVSRMIL